MVFYKNNGDRKWRTATVYKQSYRTGLFFRLWTCLTLIKIEKKKEEEKKEVEKEREKGERGSE